ncbi:flagellar hook-associated family protein [Yersinia pseudotuberculosis IP 32953]|uniref:Flagellar hook-associated protein 2 n=1 Tax=Yersinia pseudotuberculosis serotype I (strain IP32953) TaxID=273123 RepID=Q666D3_YERPS|nr:flagellar hook-associated family protein [Yersinia pseudotuberculosis]AJJ55076.1 flagellar hook-associated family protein [Yersinia pseudotuberculosis IP 32953]AJJ68355.1 flagellar hook-associated family protein [Yersinia pseudotuberculosis PB1/+]PSH12672.1 flagellar hook protein [Yersinia pseudotuberculosis]PSH22138.1 flagellar hook protein [Yersinia pseudotuberculosis]
MSLSISGVDPEKLAEISANKTFASKKARLAAQQKQINDQKASVNKLQTAVTDFRSALNKLNQRDSGLLQIKTTSSDDKLVSASATAQAVKGKYHLFVEQLAKTDQIALKGITDDKLKAATGPVELSVGKTKLTVDLTSVNSLEELANAINNASDKAKNSDGQGITASLVRTGSDVVLTLSSNKSGAAHTLDVSDLTTKLSAIEQQLAAGQDAIVWLGEQNKGIKITHDSNVLDKAIQGLTLSLQKEKVAVEVGVEIDNEASEDQLKTFVSKFNQLQKLVESSSSVPNASAISTLLNNIIRSPIDGERIHAFGVISGRDGELTIDSKQLQETLKANTQHFSEFFNGKNGVVNKLTESLEPYINATSGLFKLDNDRLSLDISAIQKEIDAVDNDYKRAYDAHLVKFSGIAAMISKMNVTMKLFEPEKEQK